jgi:PAS domain S-box-containing protein
MPKRRAMRHQDPLRAIDELGPGDHLCCIYETEAEHRAVLTPFLRQGLERGEKVLYVVDEHTAEAILDYLRDDGFGVEQYLESGQLSILSHDEAYTRGGSFDPDAMIALLEAETERALSEGYTALRVTGEMCWALRGLPGSERLIEYEAKLNQFFPGRRCLAICQYDRRRFDPEVLLDVLRTHPMAVMGTELLDNFYYVPPEEILDQADAEAEFQRWVENLTERKRREEVKKGLTQRIEAGLRAGNLAWWEMELPSERVIFDDRKAEMLGHPPERFRTYEDFTGLLHPHDREAAMEAMRNHLNGKAENYEVEYRIETSTGEYKWFRDVGGIVDRNETTGQLRVVGIVEDITQRRQAEEALRERVKELTCLYAVSRDLQEATSISSVFRRVVDHLTSAMQFPEITAPVIEVEGERFASEKYSEALSHSLHATIRAEGEARGHVRVYYTEERPFLTPHEQGLLNSVAGALGIWLERREAEKALRASEGRYRKRAAQLALLSDISKRIAGVLDLEVVLEDAVRLVQESFGYHHVGLFIMDCQRDELVMRARAGDFTHLFPSGHRLELGQGMVGWAAHSGERLMANDVNAEPRYVDVLSAEIPTRSELTVPMRIGGEIIGVLDVQSPRIDAFDQNDVMVIETLADQVAVAIENARLFQAERRQRELTEALEEASAAVGSTLELDRVLDQILEQVDRVVAGDAFNVMLVEGDVARIARWRGYDPSTTANGSVVLSTPISRYPYLLQMVESGEPVVVSHVSGDEDWIERERQSWWRSYVAAPIVVTGLTVGFLNVIGAEPGQFRTEDAQRLEVFARHAAIAIENAQLFQEVRNYADRLEERVQERTAQIQAQYSQLEAILSSTADGIMVLDDKGKLLQVNPVAEAWLAEMLPPEDAESVRQTARDLMRRAEERPEAILELENIDLQLNAAPVTGSMGEGRAVIALHDVSHLKELDRMKSRFVSNVSHELRTPITSIILYGKLMRNQPGRWKDYLQPLMQEAERQGELVEEILQISRMDAGRQAFDPRPTPLDRLVVESIESHQILAERQGLTLVHRSMDSDPAAWGVPERLRQVLNNLLKNAIQYTPEGGEVVISTGRRRAEGRTWATMMVADSGIGIPEDELPHIFERFFRGEGPQSRQISGSGLGLAIVKENVELHGGRITVESDVGSGSAFTIWLPLSD